MTEMISCYRILTALLKPKLGHLQTRPFRSRSISRKMTDNNTSNTSDSKSTLFTDKQQTQMYAKFRPCYSQEVFDKIVSFCKEGKCDFHLAVDAACGSGQSTVPLSKYFQEVRGFDISEQQIANAPAHLPNVHFSVASAENFSSVASSSVDLVTVAQAFHWFDQHRFFHEADRVLKPGGTLAVYGYGTNSLEPQEADVYFQQFYSKVREYFPEGRKMVEDKYADIVLPYNGWKRDDSLSIVKECSMSEFVGYLASWSAVTNYKKANPGHDLLEQVEQRLMEICSKKPQDFSGSADLVVTWPIFLLLGHKPC